MQATYLNSVGYTHDEVMRAGGGLARKKCFSRRRGALDRVTAVKRTEIHYILV